VAGEANRSLLSPHSRRWAFAATVAVTGVLLAACGPDDSSQAEWANGTKPGPQASSAASRQPPGSAPKCAKPTAPAGWGALKVSDDFNGKTLSSTKWSVYHDPDGKVPRDQSRVTVSGGELKITGGIGKDGKDESGGISSNTNLMYGHVDVCTRVDIGPGYSAILLMWPQSEKWPDDGEIDISEVNKGPRLYTNSYLHNHPTNDRLGHQTYADFSQWHVLSMDWTPTHVTIYLDGEKQWTAGLDARTKGLVPTTSPMHLAIQLDKGCDPFVQCRDDTTPSKVVMHTDWVRIYAYKDGAGE
jgi:beta-glucanase (GH16 family)